jgi:hypothetical protein
MSLSSERSSLTGVLQRLIVTDAVLALSLGVPRSNRHCGPRGR